MMHGRFFEDFTLGETIEHGTPRTISEGDASLYMALYGGRFAPQSGEAAAQALGYRARPLDDWLVFHIVFGKSVPDISRHAIANLGYAQGRWHMPVYAGDSIAARSEIIGLKPNRDGTSGIVYVHTYGYNQNEICILDYIRWVMVPKHDVTADIVSHIPELTSALSADVLTAPPQIKTRPAEVNTYKIGTICAHGDGMTIENGEHMLATRLYQNTARVHFDEHAQATSRFGTRLVYGGHIISLVRSLSFNELASAYAMAGLNSGRHIAPVFAGDTIYGWSIILDITTPAARDDIVALRIRHIACKNSDNPNLPLASETDLPENAVLDIDLWAWAWA